MIDERKAAVDAFVEEARLVTVSEAADRLGVAGLKGISKSEEAGPCPVCGGTDRFAINRGRGAWNCRGADGGRDGISLAAHLLALDVSRREDFLQACAEVLGRAVPGDAPETEEEREAREGRLAERRAAAEAARVQDEAKQNAYRKREIAKARGKWEKAVAIAPHPELLSLSKGEGRGAIAGGQSSAGGFSPALRQAQDEGKPSSSAAAAVLAYLTRRLGGFAPPVLPFARAIAFEPYWLQPQAGKRLFVHFGAARPGPEAAWREVCADGRMEAIFEAPAMVLPFVDPSGAVVGCHLTFLDPHGPKGRPSVWLRAVTVSGKSAGEESVEKLPTKKMRGTKKGGLIPLTGFVARDGLILPDPARPRLVIGEGIENVLAVAVSEDCPADTIYAAAGDLGNLAGRAAGTFPHPTLKNKGGKAPLRVAGPEPKPDEPPDAACQAPASVTEILLVADGDSEIVATAAAMMRAESRLSVCPHPEPVEGRGQAGRTVATAWPPQGADFCDVLLQASKAA
ncbi:primase-helicase zinc-binding domain-containing protein [Jiella marina]|uniref:primase-helicase zinc-binding domain-containing protein n=1 Tax=Jiella sp. LLJ827 TaxID=2917712 RepID=UPI0021019E08|nr:primase-helicase zinc-binding domain-containing protein [Jiella sp. LLJ827]MCQ0986418.1 hypothetical protein [Jiella sp. LLJ827]